MQTNGGTIAPGKEIKSYTGGKSLTLPGAADITRGGYTFEGWYEDSGFSGSPVTEISSTDTGDKIFYAKWKQNTVPVTPAQTEHNDANHDNTNHDNSGDTKESSGTAPVSYPALTLIPVGEAASKQFVRSKDIRSIFPATSQPVKAINLAAGMRIRI